MESIKEILKKKVLPKSKKVFLRQPWQVRALEIAQKLNIKPDGQWFKAFKWLFTGEKEGWIDSAFTFVVDANCRDKKTLFYWKLHQLKVAYLKKVLDIEKHIII